jgi:FAD/FMN-containing dehydrogenase
MTIDLDGLIANCALSSVVTPEDGDLYESLRRVANHGVDRRPLAIVRCKSARDVEATIRFARENNIRVSARSGGHGYTGDAIIDQGITMDLRAMNAIQVDRAARRARIEPGALMGPLMNTLSEHGLMMPIGGCTDVGISGYALGGGWSDIGRAIGLCCDNLVSAEVITSNGDHLRVSKDEHPDLFWALRGAGGGHFGTVISFDFQLHPINPEMPTITAIFPIASLDVLLPRYFALNSGMSPDALTLIMLFKHVPGVGPAVIISGVHFNGTQEEAAKTYAELVQDTPPLVVDNRLEPYVAYKTRLDGNTPAGKSLYVANSFLKAPFDAAGIAPTIAHFMGKVPSPESSVVYFAPMGGQIGRGDRLTSSFAQRDQTLMFAAGAAWDGRVEDNESNMSWARGFKAALGAHLTGGVYVNEPAPDVDDWKAAYFGDNYERLRSVKRRYDPIGLFVNTEHNLL